jgi:biopolymer transport protein ExbD
MDLLGYKPKLHLRGDKEAVFKYSRQVIRAAAKGGVDQVVFAVYVTAK